jgi:hypothetical protein
MDVSGGILAKLDAGNPCRHDEALHFHHFRPDLRVLCDLRGEKVFGRMVYP